MARGDGRLFPRGGVWWAAFCFDGVEKVARVSARATKPKPSSLCLAWPERKNIPASKTHIICAVFIGRPAVALGKV